MHDARRHRIDPRRLHVRKHKVGKRSGSVAETRRAKVIHRRRLHHHEGGRHEVSDDGDVAESHDSVRRIPRYQVRSKHRESSPAVRGTRRGRRGQHHRRDVLLLLLARVIRYPGGGHPGAVDGCRDDSQRRAAAAKLAPDAQSNRNKRSAREARIEVRRDALDKARPVGRPRAHGRDRPEGARQRQGIPRV